MITKETNNVPYAVAMTEDLVTPMRGSSVSNLSGQVRSSVDHRTFKHNSFHKNQKCKTMSTSMNHILDKA